MIKAYTTTSLFCLTLATVLNAETPYLDKQKSLSIDFSYVGDNATTILGGKRRAYTYLGYASLDISFDIEKVGWWKGGQFFINAANTHGGTPSEKLIGDIQTASNIEAGNHTYIEELWYKQALGKTEFTLGLQDLNVELANTEYGGTFLNSSFGVLPTISLNLFAPIFPLTSVGITAKWIISDNTFWINALYDGSPTDFDHNPYNLKWEFNSGDGLLGISEFHQKIKYNDLSGSYKIGIFTHNHIAERVFVKNFPDTLDTNTWGIYSIMDQDILKVGEKKMGIFLQLGYSPSKTSTNNFYVGTGLNVAGFLSKSNNDILGLALAHTHLRENNENETTLELTWHKPLGEHFFIHPDIQYIIHPSGQSSQLQNALVAFIRFGFNY